MTFTLTTNLSMGKPDFNHPGGYLLYNAALDTLDGFFGVTSFTAGSVPFSVAGKLSQDNASFKYVSNTLTLGRTVAASKIDLLDIQRSGVSKGRVGLDASDRLRFAGPNITSDFMTVDATDSIQFGAAVASPLTKLRSNTDMQIVGTLRVGSDATYGALPIDPVGGIQLGRDITAQDHGLVRFYRQGAEKARIGLDGSDRLALKIGANDSNALIVGVTGEIYLPAIGTTASAANAFLNSGSSPANSILRSTSARKYKTDIEDLTDWTTIRRLRPITYRSLAEADDKDRQHVGFVAEEVAEVEPRLVHYMDGQPDGVQYERLSVYLVAVVQNLLTRIEALEAR